MSCPPNSCCRLSSCATFVVLILVSAVATYRPATAIELPVQTFVTGAERVLYVYWRSDSASFSRLREDLTFTPGFFVRSGPDGAPLCTFTAENGIAGTAEYLPEGCTDAAACTGIRLALTANGEPTTRSSSLVRCEVGARRDAAWPQTGCSYRVDCIDADATDATGRPLRVLCAGGRGGMERSSGPVTSKPSVRVTPESPMAGDTVEIEVELSGAAYASYSLAGYEGFLDVALASSDPYGHAVFTGTALRGGRIELTAQVRHEITISCDNDRWYSFVTGESHPLALDIRDLPGSVRLEVESALTEPIFPNDAPRAVPIEVSLAATEAVVAALRHHLDFAPGLLVAPRNDGEPDCGVVMAGGADHARFDYEPEGCTVGTDCEGLFVEILVGDGIAAGPEAAPLYRCNVIEVPAFVSDCHYPIECGPIEATAPDGEPWLASCHAGSVSFNDFTNFERVPIATSIHVDRDAVRVGESLTVAVATEAVLPGDVQVSLDGSVTDSVRILSGDMTQSGTGGMEIFELRAVHPGLAVLQAKSNQTASCGCLNYTFLNAACAQGVSERLSIEVLPEHCPGDCDGNRAVTVDEILLGVSVALGLMNADACPGIVQDPNQVIVTVADVVAAIDAALHGCP